MWIGTRKGLSALRANRIEICTAANGLPERPVSAIAQDRQGVLWVGSEAGLFRSLDVPAAGRMLRFRPVRDLPALSTHVRVLCAGRDDSLWVGTDLNGLVRIRQGRARAFGPREGLPHNAVRALVEDRDGTLWIGTKAEGLASLKGERFTRYSTRNGLSSDAVQSLYLDSDGELWISTRDGLNRYRDGRFAVCTVRDGLFSNHVYGIVEDNDHTLWMTCSRGIFKVPRARLRDLTDGKARSVISTAYGREHGVSGAGAVGHQPVCWKSTDGRIWFATLTGLAVVDPATISTNRRAPPVHLESVRIDDRDFPPHGAVTASPGEGDLVVGFTALSFVAPEKVRFKYRLEGFDQDWRDGGTNREAHYTNLRPGRYHFRVTACNNDGVWNESGVAVSIELQPHFYQTIWFYGLCVLFIALAGAATQRVRVVRLMARERELGERVQEALADIKILRGLLPICASCKKIRDDSGYWKQMETYIHEHSEANFSHGICPDCLRRLYPDSTTGPSS